MRILSSRVALLCVAASVVSGQALAQGAAPAAPKPMVVTGPAIPGLCIINNDAVLLGSAVGKFSGERLRQLKAQSDAELNTEAQGIKTDGAALQAQKATLPADQYEQRGEAINARINALQQKAQLRQAELQKTEEKVTVQIQQTAEPIMQQAFTQHNCSVLFTSSAIMYGAPSMDITRDVLTGLDAKLTQIQFDREHLDQQGGLPAGQ